MITTNVIDDTIGDFLSSWINNRHILSEKSSKTLENYYYSYVRHFGIYMNGQYTQQTAEILALIKQLKSPKVLEVGCGCGTEALWFALNGAEVTAIDISHDFLETANERKEILQKTLNENSAEPRQLHCDFKYSTILSLDDDVQFDIVWMEQSFHHLEPRAEVLEVLKKIVKKNGYIVFSESNAWNPLIQAFLIKFRGFNTIIEYEGHMLGNERILTPMKLKNLIKDSFDIVSVRYFRLFPNRKIADKMCFAEKYMPKCFKFAFTHYNLVARKL